MRLHAVSACRAVPRRPLPELITVGSGIQEVMSWCHNPAAAPTQLLLSSMAADASLTTTRALPASTQVIGTALALLLLSGGTMSLWAGVLVAAASAYLMLFLERLGVRYLEVLFELLIAGAAIGQLLRSLCLLLMLCCPWRAWGVRCLEVLSDELLAVRFAAPLVVSASGCECLAVIMQAAAWLHRHAACCVLSAAMPVPRGILPLPFTRYTACQHCTPCSSFFHAINVVGAAFVNLAHAC